MVLVLLAPAGVGAGRRGLGGLGSKERIRSMSKGAGFFVGAFVGAVAAILLGIPSFTADGNTINEPPLFDVYCETSSYFRGKCDISVPGTSVIVLASAGIFGAIFAAFSKSSGSSSSGAGGAVRGQQGVVSHGQVNRPEGEGLGDTGQLIEHRSIELKAVQERAGAVAEHLEQLKEQLKKKSQGPHWALHEEAEQSLLDAERELVDRSAEVTRLQSHMQRLEDSVPERTRRIESARAIHSRLSEELEEARQVAATMKRGREFREAEQKEKSLCSQISQSESDVQTQIRSLEKTKMSVQTIKDKQTKAEQLVEEAERLVEERTKQLDEVKRLESKLSVVELEELLVKAKQLVEDSAGHAREAEQLADKLAQDTTIPQPTRQREILTIMLHTTRELVEECGRQSKDAQAFVSHLEEHS